MRIIWIIAAGGSANWLVYLFARGLGMFDRDVALGVWAYFVVMFSLFALTRDEERR